MLYNIKTVASFSNFEFEMERYNDLIDRSHKFGLEKEFKLGISSVYNFYCFSYFFVAVLYREKIIIDKNIMILKIKYSHQGDILSVFFLNFKCNFIYWFSSTKYKSYTRK